MDTVYLHGVLVSDFRLENTTAAALYGTKNVPVLSKDDPIIWKLIRRAHISSEGIHRTFRGTFSNMVSGKFPVLCNQMSTCIKVFMRNCVQCLRWRQDRFKVALQPVYTAVKAKVLPFEELSLDMLGSMKAFPWTNAKREMDIFPLLAKCVNTGCVMILLMDTPKTVSVILGMLTIEARLGVKIMKISVDAGSNFLVENLDPALSDGTMVRGQEGKRLFGLLRSHTL